MDKSVQKVYGNRVRVRVCGLCWQGNKLLMVNHQGLYSHDFWAPPGGGIEFGQSSEENLIREFQEETGLKVTVNEFRFACEFVQPPLHAIELFFGVTAERGLVSTGTDPEMEKKDQIIKEVRYLSMEEIAKMPENHKHGVLKEAKTVENVLSLRGYFKI